MKAIWKGEIIAESNETIILEGNHYFPKESIVTKHYKENSDHTTCPYKGTASYYDIVVDDHKNPSAAWYYTIPKKGYEHIANYIAFWKGIEVGS